MVGTARFELATPGSQSRCAARLRHVPFRSPYRPTVVGPDPGSRRRRPIDRMEPRPPTERIDPVDPIDRIEPDDPIERIDPADPRLRIEPAEKALNTLRKENAESALAAECVERRHHTDRRDPFDRHELDVSIIPVSLKRRSRIRKEG